MSKKTPRDTLTVFKPSTEGMCCRLKFAIEDSEIEIEFDAFATEALAMTLLGMVEVSDSAKEARN